MTNECYFGWKEGSLKQASGRCPEHTCNPSNVRFYVSGRPHGDWPNISSCALKRLYARRRTCLSVDAASWAESRPSQTTLSSIVTLPVVSREKR